VQITLYERGTLVETLTKNSFSSKKKVATNLPVKISVESIILSDRNLLYYCSDYLKNQGTKNNGTYRNGRIDR
jgi:hypothetical protein